MYFGGFEYLYVFQFAFRFIISVSMYTKLLFYLFAAILARTSWKMTYCISTEPSW